MLLLLACTGGDVEDCDSVQCLRVEPFISYPADGTYLASGERVVVGSRAPALILGGRLEVNDGSGWVEAGPLLSGGAWFAPWTPDGSDSWKIRVVVEDGQGEVTSDEVAIEVDHWPLLELETMYLGEGCLVLERYFDTATTVTIIIRDDNKGIRTRRYRYEPPEDPEDEGELVQLDYCTCTSVDIRGDDLPDEAVAWGPDAVAEGLDWPDHTLAGPGTVNGPSSPAASTRSGPTFRPSSATPSRVTSRSMAARISAPRGSTSRAARPFPPDRTGARRVWSRASSSTRWRTGPARSSRVDRDRTSISTAMVSRRPAWVPSRRAPPPPATGTGARAGYVPTSTGPG